jgi:parallel beta-helix repeat protein
MVIQSRDAKIEPVICQSMGRGLVVHHTGPWALPKRPYQALLRIFKHKTLQHVLLAGLGTVGLSQPSSAATVDRAPGWVVALPDDVAPVVLAVQSRGQEWFVDPTSGDDAAKGHRNAPWKTLSRLLRANLQDGDVVRLHCGGIWRERLQLDTRTAPSGLTLAPDGDCGPGAAPSIRGSDAVDLPWQDDPAQRGVMVNRRVGAALSLFFKGQRMPLARMPQPAGIGQEFALADSLNSPRSFRLRGKERKQVADHDLAGASVYVRPVPWQVEKAVVTQYDPVTGTVTLDKDLSAPILTGAGYILEGKRWMLDAPGEWFLDEASRTLSFIAPAGQRPQAGEVEVAAREKAIVVRGLRRLRLVGLDLRGTTQAAADVQDAHGIQLESLNISEPGEHGVLVYQSDEVAVRGSRVTGAGWGGVFMRDVPDAKITGNFIVDTGLLGRAGGSTAAIVANGERSLVANNVIWRAANLGIRFVNKEGTRIQDNAVLRSCMRMTDCGGIYTWTARSADQATKRRMARGLVKDNTVLGGSSNLEGAAGRGRNQTVGIYLDEMTGGVQVEGNLVAGTENGVYLHNAQFNDIVQNTFRSITHANITAHNSMDGVDVIRGNRFRGNSMVTRPTVRGGDEVFAFKWQQRADPARFFARSDANEVQDNQILRAGADGGTSWYVGEGISGRVWGSGDWKRFAGRERERALNLPPEPVAIARGEGASLIDDGNFSDRPGSWVPYFNPAGSGGLAKTMACDGGHCLRLVTGHPGDLLSSKSFRMDSQAGRNQYVLRYTVQAGPKGATVRAVVRRQGPPFENFGLDQAPVRLNPGQVWQAELPFEAASSDPARVDFYAEPGLDLFLRQVTLSKGESPLASKATAARGMVLVNLTSKPYALSCQDARLTSCPALDDQSKDIQWPVTLLPRRQVTVFPRQSVP